MAVDRAASDTGTDFTTGLAEGWAAAAEREHAIGPYELAWRRLRRNKVALAFGGLFVLILVVCLLAPVYSHDIAHIGPNDNNIQGTVKVGGKVKDVVSSNGLPIGPTWRSHYFFGADRNGRDVAVRLPYGGRHPPAPAAPPAPPPPVLVPPVPA